jgi:hypothetical protein
VFNVTNVVSYACLLLKLTGDHYAFVLLHCPLAYLCRPYRVVAPHWKEGKAIQIAL